MSDIRNWLSATYLSDDERKMNVVYHRPRIVCVDGFSMSVQGSFVSYSEPRSTVEFYESMEIGFPTHFDDPEFDNNYGQVCGYVPIDDIQKVITRHGGIKMKESLKGYENFVNAQKYLRIEDREEKLKRILKDNI